MASKKLFNKMFVTLLCLLWGTCLTSFAQTTYEQLLTNIANSTLKDYGQADYGPTAASYMALMNDNGAFTDVNYDDDRKSDWSPVVHYNRLVTMAVAYISPYSSKKGDNALFAAVNKSFLYWANRNPQSTNWWYHSIGIPQYLGLSMCLMRMGEQKLPADTESAIINIMAKAKNPSSYTAANKQDIALGWIYRTILAQDKKNLDYAIAQFYEPMYITTSDGIQHDYSYHLHGNQLYTTEYGNSLLTAFFKVAFYIKGTEYDNAENAKNVSVMGSFIREGFVPNFRGSYILFNTGGRVRITRSNGIQKAGFSESLTKMAELEPQYADFYENAAQRISGKQPADYKLEPRHYHYWRSDYAIHQRTGYSVDFRTASTRTCRVENLNEENLKGYFLCDGCTEILVDGNEYLNIFPVWDWAHIPGTTTPHMQKVPVEPSGNFPGQSTFTGGVSDGRYGCATYQYIDKNYNVNTSAKKSWFCFDNEIVCMGTDIKSSNENDITTTINQTLLSGDVVTEDASANVQTWQKGEHQLDNLKWMNHNKVTYYFPKETSVTMRNDIQEGNWYDIIHTASNATVSANVFLSYINHGKTPENADYLYYILPNTTSITAAKGVLDDLTTINSDTLQMAYNPDLKMIQAIFHQACTLTIDGGIEVKTSKPCALMITGIGSADARIFISDPSYALDSMTAYVTVPGIHTKKFDVYFETSTALAGTTNEAVISELPDFTYYAVESITPVEDVVELSYENLVKKPAMSIYPENATNPCLTFRSDNPNVAMTGPDGSVVAVNTGETTIHVSSGDGPVATYTVKVANDVHSVEPVVDTYVNSGETTTNYGTESILKLRNDGAVNQYEIYLRFPLDYLDSIDVTNIQMKAMFSVLYADVDACKEHLTIYPCTNNTWKENTFNWTTKLSNASTLILKTWGPAYAEDYNSGNIIWADVTSYGMRRYDIGAKALTLHLAEDGYTKSSKGMVQLGSRENSTPIFRPRLYFNVGKMSVVGISSPKAVNSKSTIYTLDGKQITTPQKGLNIMLESNGKVRKVIVK